MMDKQVLLFIEGQRDGQWWEVEKSRWEIRSRVLDPPGWLRDVPNDTLLDREPVSIHFRTEVYYKKPLIWNKDQYEVMALDGIKDEDLFPILLEGYRHGRVEKR